MTGLSDDAKKASFEQDKNGTSHFKYTFFHSVRICKKGHYIYHSRSF